MCTGMYRCRALTMCCRRPELDSLRRTESERADGFTAMLQAFALASVRGVEGDGPQLRRRLAHLVRRVATS